MTNVSTFKAKVNKMLENNVDMSAIKKYIKEAKVLDGEGQPMKVDKKYKILGIEHTSKPKALTIEDVAHILDELERQGVDINELGKGCHYEEYLQIKQTKFYDESGKRITLEEVFALAGHSRKPKRYKDTRQRLIAEVEEYKNGRGSFHVKRADLPFATTLDNYKRQLLKQGVKMSSEEIMHDLGYMDYSNMYYRLLPLQNISAYRDKNGYVDSYRKDDNYKGLVSSCADYLELPTPLVIMLICNEDLESSTLSINYFEYVKEELLKYLSCNDWSFVGIKTKAPHLYSKIRTLKKYVVSGGEAVSTHDVLEILGLSEYENNFRVSSAKPVDLSEIMLELKELADNQEGKLYRKDIPNNLYRKIVDKAVKHGITVKAYFNTFNIEYVDGVNTERLKMIYVTKYPYLAEMRKMRDGIVVESGVSLENGYTKEQVFEERVRASKFAYEEYKSQIYNFSQEEENE